MKRIAREIKNKTDLDYLFSLTEKDLMKRSTIMELFGQFGGKQPRFNTYDIISVPPNTYGVDGKKNKNTFKTTVGIWVFNKVFIEPHLFDQFKYVTKTITKKSLGKMMDTLTYALLENKITLDAYKDFILKGQRFMPYVSVLSAGFTMKMLTITKRIDEEKARLIKKYKADLDAGKPETVIKIQNELLDLSKEILKGDPSLDSYNSGSRGSFNNNFKNLFIMKGLTKNPDHTKGYNIIMSNYMEGITKDEYADFANSLVEGPYSRSVKTETGGYWEKLCLPAYQHIKILKEGSDCHTKRTIIVHLAKDNVSDYMYSYIVDRGKLVELTTDTMNNYIGKDVKMRFSSLCESKNGICHACAGNAFHRLGIENVGAAIPQVPAKLKLTAMKAFHDSQVVLEKMDPKKAFGF